MRIFILEDDMRRVAKFEQWLAGHDLTQVDSCESVGAYKPPYDLVLLDHDLGGRQLEQHEDSGETFIKLLGQKLFPDDRTIWIVHSFNPEGSLRMGYDLSRAYHQSNVLIAPFGGPDFFKALQLAGIEVARELQKEYL